MSKQKNLGLSPRRYRKKEEHEVYDDSIKASETVGREDILIQFWTPGDKPGQKKTGRHFGSAIQWHSRKHSLVVKALDIDRNFEIEEGHCITAWRTELPPESKMPKKTVERAGKDGQLKRVPNPLFRLQLMEMTKGDRDKLRVIWD